MPRHKARRQSAPGTLAIPVPVPFFSPCRREARFWDGDQMRQLPEKGRSYGVANEMEEKSCLETDARRGQPERETGPGAGGRRQK